MSSAVNTVTAARQQQTCVEIESSPVVATTRTTTTTTRHGMCDMVSNTQRVRQHNSDSSSSSIGQPPHLPHVGSKGGSHNRNEEDRDGHHGDTKVAE